MNESKTADIWVRGAARLRIIGRGAGEDYAWVRIGAMTYISVYLTPNCATMECRKKVVLLKDRIRDLPGDVVVGMTKTNKLGRLLLKMAARLHLVVANTFDVARRTGTTWTRLLHPPW